MYSTRLLRLLLVALSIFSIAQAIRVEAIVAARQDHDLVRRQRASGTGGATPDASTTSSSTSTPPSSTSTPPSSTSTRPTSTPPTTTSSTSTTTSDSPTTSSTPNTTPPPSSTPISISTRTTVVITTDSAGLTSSYTSTSLSTSTPTLASQNGGGNMGGMSEGTKNIIIGVVVGVGGFIILLVVGLVIWRIWGKKKQANEDDGLMDYGTAYSGPTEKSEPTGSTSGRTPFQSTLESYHAPTQVNTASNF